MALSEKIKLYIEKAVVVLCVVMTIFQVYTAATLPLETFAQRSIHLTFMYTIGFLIMSQKVNNPAYKALHYICAALSLLVFIYVFVNRNVITLRVTSLLQTDFVFGIISIVLVLFLTYRALGIWMPLIAAVFILYAYVGPHLTGILRFRAVSLQRYLSTVYLSEQGIFGSITGVSATYVFMFILFGEFLVEFGAGQFIIDLAESVFGRFRGGSSKIAVIAAGLFGMVSGSSPVIVAGTGPFTIPLQKKAGYSAEDAGGVVAAASVGGLIMPPVMGAAVFIMADTLQMTYGEVCIHAVVCAVIYFASLFFMADIRALKRHDAGVPKEELPKFHKVFISGWHNLLSIVILVYLLCGLQWSAAKSAFWAIVVLYISYFVKAVLIKEKKGLKEELIKLVHICRRTGEGMIGVCAACTCAGIIIGSLSATGLDLRMSSMLVALSGGSKLLLLILAMVGNIILGMGLPPLSVYIVMSIMVAPSLIQLGIPAFAAHMFVFYFGIMASITPPVGIAFYVASGIAGSKPIATGFTAWKFALAGFIMPYIFVYNPALLLIGNPVEIIWTIFCCLVGIVALTYAIEGYMHGAGEIPMVLRIPLIVGAIITVIPETISTVIGLIVIAAVIVLEFGVSKVRKNKMAEA